MTKKQIPKIEINDELRFFITKDKHFFDSASDVTDATPVGFEDLKNSIEELKDAENIEDDDISIFILTKLKVKTIRTVEIYSE